jgi:hypothetical protein
MTTGLPGQNAQRTDYQESAMSKKLTREVVDVLGSEDMSPRLVAHWLVHSPQTAFDTYCDTLEAPCPSSAS